MLRILFQDEICSFKSTLVLFVFIAADDLSELRRFLRRKLLRHGNGDLCCFFGGWEFRHRRERVCGCSILYAILKLEIDPTENWFQECFLV